jgi:hypothetical protein
VAAPAVSSKLRLLRVDQVLSQAGKGQGVVGGSWQEPGLVKVHVTCESCVACKAQLAVLWRPWLCSALSQARMLLLAPSAGSDAVPCV